MKKSVFIIIIAAIAMSCNNTKQDDPFAKDKKGNFEPEVYELKEYSVKLVRGQILYMPVYSHMPQYNDSTKLSMSAFVAIHNTDFNNKITLQKVQYFDTKGKLVHDFLQDKPRTISQLETVDFYIPYSDQSGIGANFLIEWKSDSLVTEPLIESITTNLKGYYSTSILSTGKVLKEIR